MSDKNKIEDEKLKMVTGGTGNVEGGSIKDVEYDPTHDAAAYGDGIGDVIYDPTHDLDKGKDKENKTGFFWQ